MPSIRGSYHKLNEIHAEMLWLLLLAAVELNVEVLSFERKKSQFLSHEVNKSF
jgi:hypothetical protein